jgi:uncharacterized membrane protein HdeD (DUF308 family)
MSVVMVVAGSLSVVLGASSVLGARDIRAGVDSEMRFYAVWYVVAGVFLLRATRRVESEAWTIRLIAAAFFVAGCSRILSWVAVGRPHFSQLILMVIELILPLIVIPWQASVARRARARADAT